MGRQPKIFPKIEEALDSARSKLEEIGGRVSGAAKRAVDKIRDLLDEARGAIPDELPADAEEAVDNIRTTFAQMRQQAGAAVQSATVELQSKFDELKPRVAEHEIDAPELEAALDKARARLSDLRDKVAAAAKPHLEGGTQ
jgi:ElaB/YqjD/DUF883 family membrane-anchored ribosome-binding protein